MAITADALLTGVKRRITMPSSQALLTDTDILALADDVSRSIMVPVLKSLNQDYFVVKTTTDLVSLQKEYAIPSRAMGRALRELKLIDAGGNRSNMSLITIEDEHLFVNFSIPKGFYFYGDKIAVVPTPSVSDYSLEVWWELPPSKLVPITSSALVSSISSTSVVVSSIPTGMINGSVVDFVQSVGGGAILAPDITITGLSGTTISFASGDIPDDLAVGDYVSLAGYTSVINLPEEAYPLFESKTCVRCLKAVGDYDAAKDLNESDAALEERNLKMILEPRIEGEPTTIVNRRGLLWARRGRFLPGKLFN